jgi:DNA-binding MarR family transcriptional regulator
VRTDELSGELAAAIGQVARMLIREGVHVNRTSLSVLGVLRNGPMRITELAASEFISQPGMTTLVSRLEDEGWVVRQPDPSDGRAVRVAITKKGLATIDAAVAARTEAVRKRIERLGPGERKALAEAVDALRLLTQDEPAARPAGSRASAPSASRPRAARRRSG